MTADEVIRAAMQLSPADREQVAQTLLESIDGGLDDSLDDAEVDAGVDAEIDAAWKIEIASRVDDIRSGRVQGLTREQVKKLLAEQRASRAV